MIKISKKTTIRIIIWTLVAIIFTGGLFLNFFFDINRMKSLIEKNLKNQLQCTIKLGDLEWDMEGLSVGFTTSEITLFDKDDNLVLQAGPSRFVWDIFNIILGKYVHFYKMEAANFYLNIHRYENDKWNIIEIFPPGSVLEVDNLKLNNGIIYFIDDFNPVKKAVLYKDVNLNFEKARFSNIREINLTSRVGSLTSLSFLQVKGKFTESKKFKWKKNIIDLKIEADKLQLANWEPFLTHWPQINTVDGEFTGNILVRKSSKTPYITVKTNTKTNQFRVEFKNNGSIQPVYIPKTGFKAEATIGKDEINIKQFESNIDKLTYTLSGKIFNWSKTLPEVNLKLKTNKFSFLNIKPYLPLSLLPASTREKIEPINDEGFVEIDLDIKGLAIQPKYYGTILLKDFNLTPESGFLNFIQGLEGKLVLDNQILNIEYLNIPLQDSTLVIKGQVDNEKIITAFNIAGKDLNLHILQDLLIQVEPNAQILNEIDTFGKLDLDINVLSKLDTPPEIKGNITFHDAGVYVFKDDPLEIKNAYGELLLDGSKITFSKVKGLINEEHFYIDGDFSLKEDENINLHVKAEHLKIIPYVISFFTSQIPHAPNTKSISGELSNVNLDLTGNLSSPKIFGELDISNIAFDIPDLHESIANVTGKLRFDKTELVIEELNGSIGETPFAIAGYVDNLFIKPSPRFRLVTDGIEVSNIWNYTKEKLKNTPLGSEAEKLDKVTGLIAIDLFLQPEIVTGNIYFQDAQINYKPLPFMLNNLQGRIVLGENDLSLFGVMGNLDESNNFNSNITVHNHYSTKPEVQGQIDIDLDPTPLIKVINPELSKNITAEGIIPTIVNFSFSYPKARLSFYSTLAEPVIFNYDSFLSKPTNLNYTLSGDLEANFENKELKLNRFHIKTEELSLRTEGTIKNFDSKEPELMIDFVTDDYTKTYMILKPIVPLKNFRIFGDIDLKGSFNGTPSNYTIASTAKLKDIKIQPPVKEETRIYFDEGNVDFYLDNEKGHLISKLKEIKYLTFHAKDLELLVDYLKPKIFLKEFKLNSDPGYIHAKGSYNPEDGSLNINAKGKDLELSKLGAFILLDPSKLAGKTQLNLNLSTKGTTQKQAIANSNGNVSFSVTNGHIGEIALLHKGLQLANLFGQGIFGFNLRNVFSLFFKYQDGDFNTIDGKLNIDNGVIKVKGFHYRANNLFLNTYGSIDLPESYINLKFYGFLPEQKEDLVTSKEDKTVKEEGVKSKVKGALTVLPETLKKGRIIIPFISTTPPQHFKFELKGSLKNQKKIMKRTRRSFKWLKGRRLEKEYKFVPKS